jgi:hypothetical protein
LQPVRLAYQPPASSTFLSEQTSHQQPASSTFLSEQISTGNQPPAKRTGYWLMAAKAVPSAAHDEANTVVSSTAKFIGLTTCFREHTVKK